jgi:Ca-activated chloride channel family protein
MTIDFGSPAWFWLFGLLPLVWLAGRAGASWRLGALHPIARSLLLICLVGALTEPVLSLPTSRTFIVYLVDASHSVSSGALETAAQAIDALNASARPDEWRILAFGGRTAAMADTGALRGLAASAAAGQVDRLVAPDATNLEQALAAARAEIPSSTNGRIVLFSDGRQTDGDSLRMAERLAAARVPVFTQPVPVRDLGDTWIEEVRLPRTPVAEATTALELVLGSQAPAMADITVREGSRVLARLRTSVAPGGSIVPVDVAFDRPGPHLIEAIVSAERDVLAENNTLLREIVVEPRPRVLYVHTATDEAGVAPLALAQSGIEMTTIRPQALPVAPATFDRWDVVVLSNVARSLLSPGAMAALGSWVEERGGGLLFIGGNVVIGEDVARPQAGYRRTEMERILPVTFDRDDEPEVALVIVLDRSWSMNGVAMELSKAAAEGAATTLAPSQMLGVITFNNAFNWDVPLARVRDSRPTLHDAIARITASGPTAIYPAIEEAYLALTAIRARAKHVILLSDGKSDPEDYEGLVKKMTSARITVSSVALGPEADVTLLRNLATWGGGRSYVVQQAQQIPEIFVKEAKNAATPGYEESGAIAAAVRQPEFFPDTTSDFPALQGRNVVTRKPQAIELLATNRGDPLLTVWPAGLGRTAMLAADVDGQWTRDWLRWRHFGAFLSTVVRWLAPRHLPRASLDVVSEERHGTQRTLSVSLEARDRDGHRENLLTPSIDVRRESDDRASGRAGALSEAAATLPLTPVAPGRYETRLVADTSHPLLFSIANAPAAVSASRIFVADHAAEYRFAAPDEQLLSGISRATGGSIRPTADIVLRRFRK